MSCPSCGDLCVHYRINSPSEPRKAIKVALQNVQDGTLREVISSENGSGPTFSELAQGAPWDDVVAFGFKCQTCGHLFRGLGGHWELVYGLP